MDHLDSFYIIEENTLMIDTIVKLLPNNTALIINWLLFNGVLLKLL